MPNVEVIKGNRLQSQRNAGINITRLRVAPYVRVSTNDEDQTHSYNSQKKYYTELTQNKPEWVLIDIYADKAVTGTKTDKRDNFQRLINDCLDGKIDLVIAKSISRFARNTVDTLKYVRMLKDRGIAVLFEEEKINTLTMDGELLLTVLSSVAQQEVENISSHVKKGLKMKMQRGELIGYQGCLGYTYDKETKTISINEAEAEIVRYIFARYLSGAGCSIIARELTEQGYKTPRGLNTWVDSTILGIINNEKYKGDILQGKTFTIDPISKRRISNMGEEDQFYCSNHHEAIISAEDFKAAQDILAKRSHKRIDGGKRERYSRKYTFSSKLICGYCGGVLSRRSWNSGTACQKDIWQCSVSTKRGKENCPNSKGIPEKVIESAFVDAYNLLASENQSVMDKFIQNMSNTLDVDKKKKELADQRKLLHDKKSKRDKLVDLNLNSVLDTPTFEVKYQQLIEEETAVNNRIAELTDELESGLSIAERIETFKKALGDNKTISGFTPDVFESTVDRVIVGGYNEDGTPDPHSLTFVFKMGNKQEIHPQGLRKQGRVKYVPNEDTTHVECVCLLTKNK